MTEAKQPNPLAFSGRELFVEYEKRMRAVSHADAEHLWDNEIGKQKKAAWIGLASWINSRISGE